MRKAATEWNVYRTRFLVQARQLTEPLTFKDVLGREHRGSVGDYLVESSDGTCRITPRHIFEDIYVAMEATSPRLRSRFSDKSDQELVARRSLPAGPMMA
ncbi:MAG TPA: hypothetical protein VHL05_09980 [Terriglobales bacterium]|nr:hypothetical protein [Terriglobales bacterium]